MENVVSRLQEDIKNSLKQGDKDRTNILRALLSAVKQKQIDFGVVVDDAALVAIVEKMIKQRRESITHYQNAKRADLQAQEELEISLLQPFMPAMMNADELANVIEEVISASGAEGGMQAMGQIMAAIKSRVAGRADMATVSKLVREKLAKAT
ncbi:MAG: GatB/YqeY domain-containing protein [Proteobacteria bacterium]|nr:GatB/YqeY domain-containing protein [Pseudomonadota bacterium]